MEPVLPDIWFAVGRAYQLILTGDTLAIEVRDPSNKKESALFKVVCTSSYGYLMALLDPMMSGGLTLVTLGSKADFARYGDQLREARFLVSFKS